MLSAYLAASRLAGPVARLILARRAARGKEDRDRLDERLGRAAIPRPEGMVIWLHGASIGEAKSMLPLIDALQAQSDAAILMTTGTVSSARQIAGALPAGAVHQFVPVDTAAAVRRFLDHWQPDLAIWVESEFWPRLIEETAARDIPMAVVNARVSAKSTARWQRAPAMAGLLLSRFQMVVAQDEETRHRLSAFGVTARFGGNLKALVEPPGCDASRLTQMQETLRDRPVWLAASTHPGEEVQALSAHAQIRQSMPDALLILAPRHPERGDALVELLANTQFARRSAGQMPGDDDSVYLADTLGEMGLWYRLAPVCFVGGSLVEMGGHTPFEPVALGGAVVHGPNVDNFAPAYAALGEVGGSIAVDDSDGLADVVLRLLRTPAERADLVAAATSAHQRLKPDVQSMARDLLTLFEVET